VSALMRLGRRLRICVRVDQGDEEKIVAAMRHSRSVKCGGLGGTVDVN
jgi:hypothetical protein